MTNYLLGVPPFRLRLSIAMQLIVLGAVTTTVAGLQRAAGGEAEIEVPTSHFPVKIYRAGDNGPPGQNTGLAKDQFGRVYAGGTGGLWQFDGLSWRLVYGGECAYPCFDGIDTIYGIAGQDFGKWVVRQQSISDFISLEHLIDKQVDRLIHRVRGGDIRDVSNVGNSAFFSGTHYVIQLGKQEGANYAKVWIASEHMPGFKFRRVRRWRGRTIVQTESIANMKATGLAEIKQDGSVQPLPQLVGEDGKAVKTHVVSMCTVTEPSAAEGLPRESLILAGVKTVWKLDDPKNMSLHRFTDHASPYSYCESIAGGMAVMTTQNGVLFLDCEGNIIVQAPSELMMGHNLRTLADDSGHIWVSLTSGIARIDYGDGLVAWDSTLIGSPRHVEHFQDRLVVVGRQGLFSAKVSERTGLPIDAFERHGRPVSVRRCIRSGDCILICESHGLKACYSVEDLEKNVFVENGYCMTFVKTEDPNIGIALFFDKPARRVIRQNGKWKTDRPLDTLKTIYTCTASLGRSVWISATESNESPVVVQRIDIDTGNVNSYPLEAYVGSVFKFEDRIFLARLFSHRSEEPPFSEYDKEQDKFVPTTEFAALEQLILKSAALESLRSVEKTPAGDYLFVFGDLKAVRASRKKDGNWQFTPIMREAISGRALSGFVDDFGNTFVATDVGLYCKLGKTPGMGSHASSSTLQTTPKQKVVLSRVTIDGAAVESDSERPQEIELDYSTSTLAYSFAIPMASQPQLARFRNRLLGQNDQWTPWSKQAIVEFAALREGSYTLEVEGRIGNSQPTEAFRTSILIHAPWFRQWWFRIGYLSLAAMGIAAVVRSRYRSQIRQNRLLTREIADRKKAEELLRHSQAEMLRQERLRTLGEMAAGVAHDVNNALMPIVAYSEQLTTDEQMPPEARKIGDAICEGAIDAAKIVRRIQPLYRDAADLRERIDIAELLRTIAHTASDITATLNPEKLIAIRPETEPLFMQASPSDIREMLLNLIYNAMDAIERSGEIVIRCYSRESNLFIEVEDEGCGMSEEVLSRCIDSFYSTKRETGSGLGLATTQALLATYRGHIQIDSTEGQGSLFRLVFPTSDDNLIAHTRGSDTDASKLPSFRILIVEDVDATRVALRHQLEHLDQSVTDVVNGEEALEALRRQRFDIVMTDFSMQGINGGELCRKIPSTGFDGPVVMVTSSEPPGIREICDALLLKPTTLANLRNCIRSVTDDSAKPATGSLHANLPAAAPDQK